MSRPNQKKRSAAYWKIQYQKLNNRYLILRDTKRTEGRQSTIRILIKYVFLSVIALITVPEVPKMLEAIAGKNTNFIFSAELIKPDFWFFIAILLAISCVMLFIGYRNKRTTLRKYIKNIVLYNLD